MLTGDFSLYLPVLNLNHKFFKIWISLDKLKERNGMVNIFTDSLRNDNNKIISIIDNFITELHEIDVESFEDIEKWVEV